MLSSFYQESAGVRNAVKAFPSNDCMTSAYSEGIGKVGESTWIEKKWRMLRESWNGRLRV